MCFECFYPEYNDASLRVVTNLKMDWENCGITVNNAKRAPEYKWLELIGNLDTNEVLRHAWWIRSVVALMSSLLNIEWICWLEMRCNYTAIYLHMLVLETLLYTCIQMNQYPHQYTFRRFYKGLKYKVFLLQQKNNILRKIYQWRIQQSVK